MGKKGYQRRRQWFFYTIGYTALYLILWISPIFQRQIVLNARNCRLFDFYWSIAGLFLLSLTSITIYIVLARVNSNHMAKNFDLIKNNQLKIAFDYSSQLVDESGVSGLMNEIYYNSDCANSSMTQQYFSIGPSLIFISAIIMVIIKLSIISGIVLMLFIILFFVVSAFINHKENKLIILMKNSMGEINDSCVELIQNTSAYRWFGSPAEAIEKHAERIRKSSSLFFSLNIIAISGKMMGKYFGTLIYSGCLLLGAISIKNTDSTASLMLIIVGYVPFVILLINNIKTFFAKMIRVKEYNKSVTRFTDLQQSEGRLNMENTKFRIVSINDDVLDVAIKDNQINAIIGCSGEGKTTLLSTFLLNRKYEKYSALCGDEEVRNIPRKLWFGLVNYMPQRIDILNSNLAENILLGREKVSSQNYQDIVGSIKNMNVFKMDNNYHKKYLGHLGECGIHLEEQYYRLDEIKKDLLMKSFINQNFADEAVYCELINTLKIASFGDRSLGEDGKFVSGGEKQKIALARFLLRTNAIINIIDEPFTNLDIVCENELLSKVKKYLENKTSLIVTHKYSILSFLNAYIFILSDGKVEAKGTHDYLQRNSNTYNSLINALKSSI